MKQIKHNKQRIVVALFVCLATISATAQNQIGEVLKSIEQNNRSLRAAVQQAEIHRIGAATELNLSNPSIDLDYSFGNKATNNGRETELKVVQEFDFPTLYSAKRKVVGQKMKLMDAQYRVTRQEVLVEAQGLCLELVFLNKEKLLLENRRTLAEQFFQSCQKRFAINDISRIDLNKANLWRMEVQNDYRKNEMERADRLRRLRDLNNGQPIELTDTVFPPDNGLLASFDDLLRVNLASDPQLHRLANESLVAQSQVKVAQSQGLPKWSIGYRMDYIQPERFNGVHFGISIPLWENRNKVKLAKAQAIFSETLVGNQKIQQENELRREYENVVALKQILDEYSASFKSFDSRDLLRKSLEGGHISIFEYLIQLSDINQSEQKLLEYERDYHLALSELLKGKL
ncbi:MAG: outer rane efflux protein [Bacteroidetes bacterium]|nr:outer rane efflux protein [Bacteroidota bacterium]